MNIIFVCTDNFTRSVIAEFCMKDFLRRSSNTSIKVSSAGIQANNDISKYSNIHFKIMNELNIDTTGFTRTIFEGKFFNEYDVIIAMSDLHRTYIKEQYKRDVPLFNEMYNGQKTSVNIGPPDSKDFLEQMNKLVHFFYEATPQMVRNIGKYRTKTYPLIDFN